MAAGVTRCFVPELMPVLSRLSLSPSVTFPGNLVEQENMNLLTDKFIYDDFVKLPYLRVKS